MQRRSLYSAIAPLVTLTAACAPSIVNQVKLGDADLPVGTQFRDSRESSHFFSAPPPTIELCVDTKHLVSIAEPEDSLFQFSVGDPRAPDDVRNLVWVFDSADRAARVLDEIRASLDRCPTTPTPRQPWPGEPLREFRVAAIAEEQLPEIAPDHIAVRTTAILADGATGDAFDVYQRRGRVIAVLSHGDLAVLRPLAAIAAARLAGLSEAEVGD